MRRAIAVALICASAVACGGVDQKKFDAVYKAGNALQADVESTGSGTSSAASRDLLKQFDSEINALHDHTIGIQEADALKAYADSAEAYRYFFRFRAMATEEGSTQLLLKGPNLEVATRFKLPVDTRNGAKSVSRAQAITILLQAAEQRMSDGNRFLKGK